MENSSCLTVSEVSLRQKENLGSSKAFNALKSTPHTRDSWTERLSIKQKPLLEPSIGTQSHPPLANKNRMSINVTRAPTGLPESKDPLDAMDALEEELEEVRKSLPAFGNGGLDSPSREDSPLGNTDSQNHNSSQKTFDSAANRKVKSVAGSKDIPVGKPKASSMGKVSDTNGRPMALKAAPRTASGSTSVSSQPRQKLTLAPRTPQMERPKTSKLDFSSLSTSKPGFTPSRSTKQPTRPTFELPGEAISRRTRAQRDERRKKEEEDLQQKRAFKASRVRYSTIPTTEVRGTVTSRSRASLSAADTPRKFSDESGKSIGDKSSGRMSSCGSSRSKNGGSDQRPESRPSFVVPGPYESMIGAGRVYGPESSRSPKTTSGINGRKTRNSMIVGKLSTRGATTQPSQDKELRGRDRQPVEERAT